MVPQIEILPIVKNIVVTVERLDANQELVIKSSELRKCFTASKRETVMDKLDIWLMKIRAMGIKYKYSPISGQGEFIDEWNFYKN